MGRGVEQAMLYSLISRARALDADRVDATCIPTARNAPCLAFFDRQSQFTRAADGPRYSWDLLRSYAPPVHVAIEFHDDAGVTEPCGRPS
jgi:predicted enzyme involved in methoxymalonyl-ACP biosynthesis